MVLRGDRGTMVVASPRARIPRLQSFSLTHFVLFESCQAIIYVSSGSQGAAPGQLPAPALHPGLGMALGIPRVRESLLASTLYHPRSCAYHGMRNSGRKWPGNNDLSG